MQRNDGVDGVGFNGGEDGGDVAGRVDTRGWGVDGGGDGGGEEAHVVVHRVDNEYAVAAACELAREVEGDWEAAVREEDVEGTLVRGRPVVPEGHRDAHFCVCECVCGFRWGVTVAGAW